MKSQRKPKTARTASACYNRRMKNAADSLKSSDVVRALAPDDQAGEREPLGSLLFPLRFLGMGLLIAWLCCTHVVSIFPGFGFDGALQETFNMALRFGDIGTFAAFALFASRIGRLSGHPAANVLAVAASAIVTGVVGLVLIPSGAPEAIVFGASVVTAVGGAFLFCLWAEAYSQMGPTQTLIYGAGSCVAAAVVSFVIGTMQAPYAILATSALPLLSLACTLLSLKILPAERPRPQNVRYPLPWKLLGIMAVAGLLSGAAGSVIPDATWVGAIHRVVATGIAGVVLIFMALVLRDRIDVRFLAKVALPLAVVALALVPFAAPAWGFAVSFMLKLAYVWFTVFVLLMLANIAYRFEVPTLRLFAIARALSEGGILLGIAARQTLIQGNHLSSETFLIGLALAGIVLVLACALVWTGEKSVNGDWGAAGISLSDKLHVPGPRERFMARCDQLAERHGLTARETEIMGLIAQRKSRAEIEHELFLSENTVKTHVRHLYAKLGARSKADVIALFED